MGQRVQQNTIPLPLDFQKAGGKTPWIFWQVNNPCAYECTLYILVNCEVPVQAL